MGSLKVDESFHNKFEWAPFTNGVAAERGRASRDTIGTGYIRQSAGHHAKYRDYEPSELIYWDHKRINTSQCSQFRWLIKVIWSWQQNRQLATWAERSRPRYKNKWNSAWWSDKRPLLDMLPRHCWWITMGLLPDTQNCGLCMRGKWRERFPRHRVLAIPTCITARACRTCRNACWDR